MSPDSTTSSRTMPGREPQTSSSSAPESWARPSPSIWPAASAGKHRGPRQRIMSAAAAAGVPRRWSACTTAIRREVQLALVSLQMFQHWRDIVGEPGEFRKTGFVRIVHPGETERLKQNVAMQRKLGVNVKLIDRARAKGTGTGLGGGRGRTGRLRTRFRLRRRRRGGQRFPHSRSGTWRHLPVEDSGLGDSSSKADA